MSNNNHLFVKMAVNAWEIHIKRANAAFDKLSDDELQQEIAPGKNRVIYLLGHLAAIHDAMVPLLGFGNRQHAELDNIFVTNPDKAIAEIPPAQQLRAWWTAANDTLADHFAALPADKWFEPHTQVKPEDFEKEPHRNKLNVLINRTNHLAYHLGQLVLVLK